MLKIAVWATKKYKGKIVDGVYEIQENGKYAGYAPLLPLKAMGIITKVNQCKKVEEFLNTEDGRAWFTNNRRFNF